MPELFDGAFRSVLILTYGAGLPFYEGVLRRQLGGLRNQVILADHARLAEALNDASDGQLRYLNRAYLAAPITSLRSAHGKAILLAGSEAGVLLVGSGNLSFDGYAEGGECLTAYRWSAENSTELAAFQAVKDLVDGLGQRGLIDPVAQDRLRKMWDEIDWIHHAADAPHPSPVRHNLNVPLGDQFIGEIGEESVAELVVMAPFYDRKVTALHQLRTRLKPALTTVIVQERCTSVDANRLAIELSGGGQAAVRAAVGPTQSTRLHAKIFIARTEARDVCMTGSPNCSTVALFDQQPAANIEMANLHVGPPRSFDGLLAGVTLGPPADPATLHIAFDNAKDRSPNSKWRLHEVRLDPPLLGGFVTPPVPDAATVTLIVGGQHLAEVDVAITQVEARSRFEAALPTDIVERIRQVTSVVLSVAMPSGQVEESSISVPYQVSVLEALDARRIDTERLRGAAAMELDDPELAQMLAELEQLLVVDGRSAWRMARADAPPDAHSERDHFPWQDIDWALVRRHPRYQDYATLRSLIDGNMSDLAVYLAALSATLRDLMTPGADRPEVRGQGGDGTDSDDESEGPAASEDEEGFDENEERTERRRQSVQARNLRLVRNYVRRNLLALESSEFQAGVGPGVVIPNAIILDRLCWWVASRDEDMVGELIDERLRLWQCLWGSDDRESSGYLAQLAEEEQLATLELFAEQQTEAVLLASMYDVYQSLDYEDKEFPRLQRIVRALVSHPCWQAGPDAVAAAADFVLARSPHAADDVAALDLADVIYDAGAHPNAAELRSAIAGVCDTEARNVQFVGLMLNVGGTHQAKVIEATIDDESVDLTPALVERLVAVWMALEDLAHYRCRAGDRIASYDAAKAVGWWTDLNTETDETLEAIQPVEPAWLVSLETFVSTVAARRSA